jgi:uncharacterized lipoprotein YmbA
MIYAHFRRPAALILGLFLTVAAGCASSPPSRFYALSTLENPQPAISDSSQAGRMIVAVGPVAIPDYMDRPQIVTRTGRNGAVVNEFDRWAGSLEDDISRVLTENLSSSLPVDLFRVVRWAPSVQAHLQIKYRVTIDVMRIELSPGGPVSLRAQWTIVNEETKSLVLAREANISETASGGDFAGMVAALSRALATLSRDIAGAIGKLDTDKR